MDFFLDRGSDVPIRRQIRGMIEYAISFGDLGVGAALPSVRELAEELDVAPMTVSQVYAELKRDGLVEARTGAGTFVADSARAQSAARTDAESLRRDIDELLDKAEVRGLGAAEVRMLLEARIARRSALGPRRVIVVGGLFEEATRSYAELIAARIGDGATVLPVTLDAMAADPALRGRVAAADLIVTFLTLRPQYEEMFPDAEIVAIRFIPSEATRLALASLDPMARIGAVSRFVSFLPILRTGVLQFAAHCHDVVVATVGDAGLAELLADRDVVVHATGAEEARALAPAGARTIEYRHAPDLGDVDRLVRPLIEGSGPTTAKREAER